MSTEISGIKGEYRRPNPQEIAILVKMFRQARGIKQAALAASAGVSERTLERLEAGKSVAAGTYRLMALQLGLDEAAFTAARYIATPEEAAERVIRQIDELEKTHVRVAVSRATDPRQILRLLDPTALVFEDSQIRVEHLETAVELKQLLLDLRDIAPDVDEVGKLETAKGVLGNIKRLEALGGYVVKVGVADTYKGSGNMEWTIAVVIVFSRPVTASAVLPNEILLKKDLKISLA
jgi:transcriptional regulator with XRE-family HTH domain